MVSTGVPIEALGRMSLDEVDPGKRSFSEPQESSEEELGMAFSPGKMVDDIVGEDDKGGSGEAEEIIFSGRATRKQLYTFFFFLSLILVVQVKLRISIYRLQLLSRQLISIPPLRCLVQSLLHHHRKQQQT